jgi:hypothetical protein
VNSNFIIQQLSNIKQVVIGIRPPLVTSLTHPQNRVYSDSLVASLDSFLTALVKHSNVQPILHISSVAAINHLQAQRMVSEADDLRTASTDLVAPYDCFKRACEEAIDTIAVMAKIPTTTLRLGAIFSDHEACIQCQALQLQARVGCYLPTFIDCNSSRNVAAAIQLVLREQQQQQQHENAGENHGPRYYYYTRPCSRPDPIPYGQYLQDYRSAHALVWAIWIPVWIVEYFVAAVHWVAAFTQAKNVPYLESCDYLLQVSAQEHSFDCRKFAREFPDILNGEETFEECFRRRRRQLQISSTGNFDKKL